MNPDPESIRIAIWNIRQAIKRGDRQTARRLARLAMTLDPSSDEPWLYLAAIASPHASIYYLEQALKINPESQRDNQGLNWAKERFQREQEEKAIDTAFPSSQSRENGKQPDDSLTIVSTSPRPEEQTSQLQIDLKNVQDHIPLAFSGDRGQGSGRLREWKNRIRRFSSHWQNWVGLILILFFILIALFAPLISPANPKNPGPFIKVAGFLAGDTTPHGPAPGYILGTLPKQLDVFHALIWGTRDALTFGLEVALLAALFGLIYGAVSGYAGGLVSSLMMRLTDSFLAFPVFAGVVFLNQLWASAQVAAGGIFDSRNNSWFFWTSGGLESPIQKLMQVVNPLILVLILFSWMPYARITNTVVASLKGMEFIEAARSLGARSSRIIFRHLLPNSIAPSLVLAARDVGAMVILQATFTFIGLDSSSTWGTMLVMGRDWILGPKGGVLTYWWVYLPATLMLALFGIGWNLFGDGISEAFDPREH
jgi:ABC-type dipeptide/oligopeptide/nickel transport system permease subunit